MKALFVTSSTNDVDSLVRAWDCWQADKSVRVMFQHRGEPNDKKILEVAKMAAPEIIFYIGACHAPGIPSIRTFLTLRAIAPTVNLCCDAGDGPWHEYLRRYADNGCFDCQVTLDGCRDAPVDIVTVTPVDPSPYEQSLPRTIRCGFSGNVASRHDKNSTKPKAIKNARNRLVWGLNDMKNIITIRRRTPIGAYSEHASFLLSCKMVINTSDSGSGEIHQIKGRVLEAGWAGCALLESEGSPIAEWMPEGSYFLYHGADHARRLVKTLSDDEIAASAKMLSTHVKDHYHPRQIYGEILERIS